MLLTFRRIFLPFGCLSSLIHTHTAFIKQEARRLGFDFCGISKAEFLEEEAPRLEKWLKENKHGEMKYMENYFDKRLDPRLLVDGAKSVISLLYNYYPSITAARCTQDQQVCLRAEIIMK